MRVISKFAHSAAINANLSALVDSKRSTRQLFPRRPGPCPFLPPGGATAAARSAPRPSTVHPNRRTPSPSADAHRVPTGLKNCPPPRARRQPLPERPFTHLIASNIASLPPSKIQLRVRNPGHCSMTRCQSSGPRSRSADGDRSGHPRLGQSARWRSLCTSAMVSSILVTTFPPKTIIRRWLLRDQGQRSQLERQARLRASRGGITWAHYANECSCGLHHYVF
jgi:hypothetical protein